MELLGEIGVDVKILIAQIVNFAVLCAILWYVLYKPIIRIFQAREEKVKKIADGLADLDKKRAETEEESRLKLMKADDFARDVLERSKKAATQFKNERLETVEKEVDRMIEESGMRLQAEREELRVSLSRSIGGEVTRNSWRGAGRRCPKC